ncbi:Putative Phosphomannomutase [Aspergillus calidoustus]|jgi:phosphomannomutase|uniref:Putative Phosphomannomutase n=1 Tax=Aspergillus calidoustus TaxID=454130 RepID=A0A0U4ZWB1_ASPCI|nr:Putative Phosphomannomutase [Aspergillus calidoustus]
MPSPTDPLRFHLAYEPQPLKFGTSGRRGLVIHLTQLEIYTNVLAEIRYLQSLPIEQGGIKAGDDFYFAHDLRPSSTAYVESENGRGGLCQAVEQALKDADMHAINLGAIPTPALTYYALKHGKGSIMVTGSHIPFDRNGYKLNTSKGELLKEHEQPINAAVAKVREELLQQPFSESLFDEQGMLRNRPREILPATDKGLSAYVQRYLDFFAGETLQGMKILVYQHSAVGRDTLVDILRKLGADVTPAGRSETFVPIDTEAIDAAQLATLQTLYNENSGPFDAIVSTDGDSDRPLLVAPSGAEQKVQFFGGDLLGMIVAGFLGVDAVVVPISSNDAIDKGALASVLEPKTKIGSPYVISGMQTALDKGRSRVCGWEANGGFLTGSDIERNGKTLTALPTRDAVLPLLCALFAARGQKATLPALFATLPNRYSRASLIRNFPRPTSMKIVGRFSPSESTIQQVSFSDEITAYDANVSAIPLSDSQIDQFKSIKTQLQTVFSDKSGFPEIVRLNYTDGIRMTFANGDVAHIRPSGNADELRIYAVADSQERADDIATQGVAEPNGLLRTLERMV